MIFTASCRLPLVGGYKVMLLAMALVITGVHVIRQLPFVVD